MRTPIVPLLVAIVLTALSCGRGPSASESPAATDASITRTEQEVTITSGTPRVIANLTIEGMSCAMMCGNSIRKALAALPGVNEAEVRYNEGEEADHAIVTYDAAQVDDARLVEAVHGLHGGQYRVVAVSVTRQVRAEGAAVGEEEVRRGGDGVSTLVPGSSVLPGVLAILTRILRG